MGSAIRPKPNLPGASALPGTEGNAGKPHTKSLGGESPTFRMGVDALSPGSGDTVLSSAIPSHRRAPNLDNRLRAAADWIECCDTVADIGCDHGRFSAVLLTENRCKRLLAADVSAKALAKAKARLNGLGFATRTVFAVADGLEALSSLPGGRADVICILGMGGDTIAGILTRGRELLRGAMLILGAQTDLSLTREAVQRVGYQLADERIVTAGGRMYLLMRALPAVRDTAGYTEQELLLGPCLLHDMPAEWKPWLVRKHRLLVASVGALRASGRNADRLAQAERELAYTAEALLALEHAVGHEITAGEGKP